MEYVYYLLAGLVVIIAGKQKGSSGCCSWFMFFDVVAVSQSHFIMQDKGEGHFHGK